MREVARTAPPNRARQQPRVFNILKQSIFPQWTLITLPGGKPRAILLHVVCSSLRVPADVLTASAPAPCVGPATVITIINNLSRAPPSLTPSRGPAPRSPIDEPGTCALCLARPTKVA